MHRLEHAKIEYEEDDDPQEPLEDPVVQLKSATEEIKRIQSKLNRMVAA
jgi:hypothetical protein